MAQQEEFDSIFGHYAVATRRWEIGVAAEGRGSGIVRGNPEQSFDDVLAAARKVFRETQKIAQVVAA